MDNKDKQDQKKFLEQQLQWCKDRDLVLKEISAKLYTMKGIAEYRIENELTSDEIKELSNQLTKLKSEVSVLEMKLESVFH